MADRRAPEEPALPVIHRDDGPTSTTAIISYLMMGMFAMVSLGVFCLLIFRVPVQDTMLALIGAIITAAVAGPAVVGGFWLASSSGAKANSAAIRQLAGAGPPPPADPSTVVEPKPAGEKQ